MDCRVAAGAVVTLTEAVHQLRAQGIQGQEAERVLVAWLDAFKRSYWARYPIESEEWINAVVVKLYSLAPEKRLQIRDAERYLSVMLRNAHNDSFRRAKRPGAASSSPSDAEGPPVPTPLPAEDLELLDRALGNARNSREERFRSELDRSWADLQRLLQGARLADLVAEEVGPAADAHAHKQASNRRYTAHRRLRNEVQAELVCIFQAEGVDEGLAHKKANALAGLLRRCQRSPNRSVNRNEKGGGKQEP
jgi:hypothetical protein